MSLQDDILNLADKFQYKEVTRGLDKTEDIVFVPLKSLGLLGNENEEYSRAVDAFIVKKDELLNPDGYLETLSAEDDGFSCIQLSGKVNFPSLDDSKIVSNFNDLNCIFEKEDPVEDVCTLVQSILPYDDMIPFVKRNSFEDSDKTWQIPNAYMPGFTPIWIARGNGSYDINIFVEDKYLFTFSCDRNNFITAKENKL